MSAPRRLGAGVAGTAAWLIFATLALADSPAPSQAVSGDPRAGQAAGFVGNPTLAIAIVVLIVVASLAVTLAWIRATGGSARPDDKAG
jgi:hypothetical protein